MAKTTCILESKSAKIAEPFGLEWATKLFGEEAVASLPTFKAGPNKGKPKGFIHWRKATKAGWSAEHGIVVGLGVVDAWISEGQLGFRHNAMKGHWLGREQNLAGSRCYLFEDGRARHAAEEARLQADREAEMAELLAERVQIEG